MHSEAYAFLETTLTPDLVTDAHILDIGSFDVNGSPRTLCATAARYVGVDRRAGPGVDTVDPDDSFDGAGAFDLVITAEMLEHADDPPALLASAWRALKPGGRLVLTAAGPERDPHCCNGGPDPHGHGEHYAGITVEDLTNWLADWRDVAVRYGASHGRAMGDVYATATKPTRRKRAR